MRPSRSHRTKLRLFSQELRIDLHRNSYVDMFIQIRFRFQLRSRGDFSMTVQNVKMYYQVTWSDSLSHGYTAVAHSHRLWNQFKSMPCHWHQGIAMKCDIGLHNSFCFYCDYSLFLFINPLLVLYPNNKEHISGTLSSWQVCTLDLMIIYIHTTDHKTNSQGTFSLPKSSYRHVWKDIGLWYVCIWTYYTLLLILILELITNNNW